MPTPKVSRAECEKRIAACNDVLRDGFPLSAMQREAARRLKIAPGSMYNTIRRAKELYSLEPDASLEDPNALPGDAPISAEAAANMRSEVQRLRQAVRSLRKDELTRKNVRTKIFGFRETKVKPPKWALRAGKRDKVTGVPTLFCSDWHHGEVVKPSEINDYNEFNLEISHERVRRLVETALHLLNNCIASPNYPGIVVALGGDMITGDIHEELTKTNDLPIMPTIVDIYGVLLWVLERMLEAFGNVYVVAVTGNHGRNTRKPQAKERYATNFDWLLYQMLRNHYHPTDPMTGKPLGKHNPNIQFNIPDGPDCYFNIFNHRYVMTHGDQFRGGDGITGPLMPIMRGRHKKASRDSSLGASWDTIMMGHWHNLMQMPHLIVNGSLKGYDEHAASMNLEYTRASQALWITHPTKGITFQMPIYVDDDRPATDRGWVSWPKVV